MKRLNIIIGKKQLAVASLTLLAGAAAAITLTVGSAGKNTVSPSAEVSKNYGDTEYVSYKKPENTSSDAYFAAARLEKQRARDEAAQVLSVMYQGGDMTYDELSQVMDDALDLSSVIAAENAVETLLRAQGFEEVLCYITSNGANVIVKTDGLDAQGAAMIKSALLSEVEVSAENITIVEVV